MADDDEEPRPAVVVVMAEYGVRDPVWDRSPGGGGDVDLGALGVDPALVEALRAWNARCEDLLTTDFQWESPEVEAAWVREGLGLARWLQAQLPGVEVRYHRNGGGDRTVRPGSW